MLDSKTHKLIKDKGFDIQNIDCTVCLAKPKISPYIPEMIKTIASVLSTNCENIAIKATTTEKLGFIGHEEGIAAFATALISKI